MIFLISYVLFGKRNSYYFYHCETDQVGWQVERLTRFGCTGIKTRETRLASEQVLCERIQAGGYLS